MPVNVLADKLLFDTHQVTAPWEELLGYVSIITKTISG